MMEHIASLLVAFGLLSAGFISPGPNIMAVIGTSMSRGRKEGLALAAGIGTGTGLWAILAVLGLTQILSAYAWTITALKILGAGYLLYLAYGAFKSAATAHEPLPSSITLPSLGRYFRRGLTVQMSNPKAALYWIAIAAVVTSATTPLWVYGVLVSGSIALSVSVHMLYALGFSTQSAVRAYTRLRRPIQAAIGTFFGFAAFKLISER